MNQVSQHDPQHHKLCLEHDGGRDISCDFDRVAHTRYNHIHAPDGRHAPYIANVFVFGVRADRTVHHAHSLHESSSSQRRGGERIVGDGKLSGELQREVALPPVAIIIPLSWRVSRVA